MLGLFFLNDTTDGVTYLSFTKRLQAKTRIVKIRPRSASAEAGVHTCTQVSAAAEAAIVFLFNFPLT